MLIRFVVLLVGVVMGVKGVEVSGAEVSGTRVMEPKGGDEVAASVVWWCADDAPWTYIPDRTTSNCTSQVATREPLVTCDCPTCPPAPPSPLLINETADYPSETEMQRLDRDQGNIQKFCEEAQSHLPLIRPAQRTFSANMHLFQTNWTEREPYRRTSLSMSIAPYKYVEITEEEKKAVSPEWAKTLWNIEKMFIPWLWIGDAIYEATTDDEGKEVLRKKIFCDRSAASETSVDECADAFLEMRKWGNPEQGGYKAYAKACTLYEWTPDWPEGMWPAEGELM